MAEGLYVIFTVFGVLIFVIGARGMFEGQYGFATIVGSIGIFIAIYFFDKTRELFDIDNEEEKIINEANEYLENNRRLYEEALLKIESFKRRGMYASYQAYDVYERNEYEKACSIVYDYEKNKKIIDEIDLKRKIRDAKVLASMVAGFLIGQKISKMSREKKEEK